jgi:hypothetical protein
MLNPLNAELNSICHLLELLAAHHILHVSRIRVNDILKYIFNTIGQYLYELEGNVNASYSTFFRYQVTEQVVLSDKSSDIIGAHSTSPSAGHRLCWLTSVVSFPSPSRQTFQDSFLLHPLKFISRTFYGTRAESQISSLNKQQINLYLWHQSAF